MSPVIPAFPVFPVSEPSSDRAPPADSEYSSNGAQNFAAVLHAATGKSNHKSATAHPAAAGTSGRTVPGSGNPPPPPSAAAPVAESFAAATSPAPSCVGGPSAALPSVPSLTAGAASDPVTYPDERPAGVGDGDAQEAQESTTGSLDDPTSIGPANTSSAALATNAAAAANTFASSAWTQVAAPDDSTGAADGTAAVLLPRVETGSPSNSDATSNTTASLAAGNAADGIRAVVAKDSGTGFSPNFAGRVEGAPPPGSPALASAAAASSSGDAAVRSTALNLALTEGSDATGAAATVVQAAACAVAAATAAASAAAASPLQAATLFGAWADGAALSGQSLSSASTTAAALSPAFALADASAVAGTGHDERAHDGGGDAAEGGGTDDGAAAAQQWSASVSSAGASDAAAAPTFRMSAPVDSSEFPQALAERVSFMADRDLSSAKLQVNPRDLGPIELEIAIQGGHAQVSMSTHSAVTREALESSVPTLRDLLNAQGFGQVSVDISQRSFQERPNHPKAYETSTPSGAASTRPAVPAATPRISPRSALDAYA